MVCRAGGPFSLVLVGYRSLFHSGVGLITYLPRGLGMRAALPSLPLSFNGD
jgi:hypothetical protein